MSGREESTCVSFDTGGCLLFLKECMEAGVAGAEGTNKRLEDEVTKVSGN